MSTTEQRLEIMDEVRKLSSKRCGPGGYKCRCCGPLPSERKAHRRRIRRISDERVKRQIETELASAVQAERKEGNTNG